MCEAKERQPKSSGITVIMTSDKGERRNNTIFVYSVRSTMTYSEGDSSYPFY
jgi:hypothetical protein